MGVVAQDLSYISQPANNVNYGAGQGPLGKTVPFTLPSTKTVIQIETEKAINGLGAKGKTAAILYSASAFLEFINVLKSNPDIDLSSLSDEQRGIMENAEVSLKNQSELEDFISRQQSAMTPPTTGETLPSVLIKNAKELVTSVNTLTSTFGDKFDVLNNYMYGLMTYLDIATGFMDKSYTLNKELSDEAKKKEKDNSLQVGDSKMSPAEIEARKNLAMLKAYDFKNTPVSQTVLEAENVVGMTPLEIEASHRSFEVEAKVFAKTPQKVKDWDENELADISPREARLVKDATVAIDTTDKINFELDDEDVDNLVTENIRSIFGYADDSGAIKEMFSRLGGVGLPST